MKNSPANSAILWSNLKHDNWTFHIAATERGLCYVGSPNKPFEEMAAWAASFTPETPLERNDEQLKPFAVELTEYLHGKRRTFTFPSHFRGTPFQTAVWEALGAIPYGETRSYSDIAQMIGKPAAVRAVGTAIGSNPVLITVPCHRVIGKNGTLTGYRGGMDMKTKLLQLERSNKARDSNNDQQNPEQPVLIREVTHVRSAL